MKHRSIVVLQMPFLTLTEGQFSTATKVNFHPVLQRVEKTHQLFRVTKLGVFVGNIPWESFHITDYRLTAHTEQGIL